MSTNPDLQQTRAEFREELDDIRSQLLDIRSKNPSLEVRNLQETVDRHEKEIKTLKRAPENADQTPQ